MRNPIRSLAFFLLIGSWLAPSITAQVITGTVRSAGGAPVPGVNIDGFDTNGDEIDLANDGTDVNGNFTTTVLDGPGVYTFVFYPPAPPTTTHLVGQRANVVVVTTTNLGTVTLAAGVLLSGRTVRTGSIPVSNVTLTVLDGATQLPIAQVQTKTNAFGQFNLAVPTSAIVLQLNANSSAFLLGSRELKRTPTGSLNLGDVFLPPGVVVTAHVQRANGTPLSGVDFDFEKVANGNKVFVLDDNTNALGNLSVVVPLGNFDIGICPMPSDNLPARALLNLNVGATPNLGTIVVPNGVNLFGTILAPHGGPAVKADVDVFDAFTGVEVPLCGDDTNGSGAYSVYVPTGTYDVLFRQQASGYPLGGQLHQNVILNAAMQLNGQLPLRGNGNTFGEPLSQGGTSTPLTGGSSGGPRSGAFEPVLTIADDGIEVRLTGLGRDSAAWLWVGETPSQLCDFRPFTPQSNGRAQLSLAAARGQRVFARAAVHDPSRGLVLGPIQAVRVVAHCLEGTATEGTVLQPSHH